MKFALRWVVLLALPSLVPAGDIKLKSGLVLREARIVQISEKLVTIVHQGGSMGVDPAEVDLEVLARAHLDLEEESAGRAQRAAAAVANAEERMARIEAQKAEQAKPAPAAGGNRNGAAQTVQGKASAAAGKAARPTVSPSARVLQLKAAFPPKSVVTANVFIPRSGQGARSYIVSSSVTNLPDGGNISTNVVKSRVQGRVEPFTYDVPSQDVWNWYRSMLQTTTLEALPRTLQMIEARMVEDKQKAQGASGGSSMSVAAQAKHTLVWFDKVLRPHLNEWRALLP
ncbi:MAG: hypothetical protein FJ397_10310 [Verrucomicrobia bacterium]|nr:hypothetical protein [Verrucomicrobiota bacterium]